MRLNARIGVKRCFQGGSIEVYPPDVDNPYFAVRIDGGVLIADMSLRKQQAIDIANFIIEYCEKDTVT